MLIVNYNSYFGRNRKERVEKMLKAGTAVKEGTSVFVDLGKLGYTKLLGTGKTSQKLKLTVASCSKGAAERIKAAGGEVITAADMVIQVDFP